MLPWPLRLLGFIGLGIMILDISARMRDFGKVVDNLSREPTLLPRHISRYKRSWCQRTVLHWAAYSALGEDGRQYVRNQFALMGYRWFHIFPDKTFTRESPFINPNFWRNLFGGTPEIRRDVRDPAE